MPPKYNPSTAEFNYQDYTSPKDWLSALAIAFNLVAIGGLAYLSYFYLHWGFYFPIVFVIATRMNALIDSLGHDATHFNLFSRKSWNKATEFIAFIPFFYSFEMYRKEHSQHHGFLMTDRDPAYQNYKHWGVLKEKPNWFWIWWVRPFLLYDLPSFFVDLFEGLRDDSDFRWKVAAFWIPLTGLSIWLGFWPLLLLYWVVPLLWLVPVIEYWTEVADHYGIGEDEDTRDSRGLFLGRFLRGHNDGYHTMHHRYPKIPWFNLPRATRDFEKLKEVEKVSGLGEMYGILQTREP